MRPLSSPLSLMSFENSATTGDEVVALNPFTVGGGDAERWPRDEYIAGNRPEADLRDFGAAVSVGSS